MQELAQGELSLTPRYQVVGMSGPSHERTFVVEVLIGEHVAGRGEGRSKRQAEQDAAHHALADPGWRELAEARLAAVEELVDEQPPESTAESTIESAAGDEQPEELPPT